MQQTHVKGDYGHLGDDFRGNVRQTYGKGNSAALGTISEVIEIVHRCEDH